MDQCQNVANSEAADGYSTESTGAIQVTSVEPTSCADQVVVEESSPNVVEQQKTEEATPENVTIPSEEVVEPEKNEEMQPIATGEVKQEKVLSNNVLYFVIFKTFKYSYILFINTVY